MTDIGTIDYIVFGIYLLVATVPWLFVPTAPEWR